MGWVFGRGVRINIVCFFLGGETYRSAVVRKIFPTSMYLYCRIMIISCKDSSRHPRIQSTIVDFSLVNIPNGLIEHANITKKIPFETFPSLLDIKKRCEVSYFITNLVILAQGKNAWNHLEITV